MNLQRDFLLERICRTCMSKDGQTVPGTEENPSVLQSIYDFSSPEQTIRIAELLTTTTPQLLIQPMDNLPKLICTLCTEKLLYVHQFQQMCIRSEQCMRSLLEYSDSDAKYSQFPELSIPLRVDETRNEDPLQGDTPMAATDEIQNYLKLEMNEREAENHTISSNEDKQKEQSSFNEKINETDEPIAVEVKSEDESDAEAVASNKKNERLEESESLKEGAQLDDFCYTDDMNAGPENEIKGETSCDQKIQKDADKDVSSSKKTLHKPEGYKCEKCPRRFAHQKSLATHRKSHGEAVSSQSHTCDLCGKKFKKTHALTRHKRTHESMKAKESGNKPYVCEYCNKAFQQSCTLKDHLRTHTGEQPFLCSECGKAFNSSSNMKQHLLRHSGLKRYECPDCPKKFPCLSDLASHKAVHRKIKPHICDICGASFGKPYQLKKHKMYHNGEKPHKCEYCEMRFVCADHMRRHMRTHTGEKPYKCNYCERAFAQSNDLIKHLRSHLGENVYKCELCPKAFRLATELREHFVEHKNDDEETRQRNLKAMTEEEEKLKITLKL